MDAKKLVNIARLFKINILIGRKPAQMSPSVLYPITSKKPVEADASDNQYSTVSRTKNRSSSPINIEEPLTLSFPTNPELSNGFVDTVTFPDEAPDDVSDD